MAEMVLQHLRFDPRQRRADRPNLGHHVDAVTVLIDHACDAAHLALDAAEAVEQLVLVLAFHVCLRVMRLELYPLLYMSRYPCGVYIRGSYGRRDIPGN